MEQKPARLDRALLWRIIDMEWPRHSGFRTRTDLARHAGVSPSTMARIRKADPTVEDARFRKIEAAFGWPADTLKTAATGDLAGLVELGAPGHLVGWLSKELAKDQGNSGTAVSG